MAVTRITSQDIFDGTIVNVDISTTGGIDATKLASGNVDNVEFSWLNGLQSQAVGTLDNQTLTSKTIKSTSNTVAANWLASSTGGFIDITGSTPTSGQQLIATGPQTATWQTNTSALATSNFVLNEIPTGTPNGSLTTFGLAFAAVSSGVIQVYKNGMRMSPGAGRDFTTTGTTGIVFVLGQIPLTNDNLLVDYIK